MQRHSAGPVSSAGHLKPWSREGCVDETRDVGDFCRLAIPTSADTQTTALDCVPPAPALMGYDGAMMQEYRDEIGVEYADCFTLAGQYLRCPEAVKSAVNAEIQTVIEDCKYVLQRW